MKSRADREITNLLLEIYHSYGLTGTAGIRYFADFEERIRCFDVSDFIVQVVLYYSVRDACELFLSCPYLWLDMSYLGWEKVINELNPRPDSRDKFNEGVGFSDIHFLCKYIGVDALKFMISSNADDSDKSKVIRYCLRNTYSLLLDDIDREDLDGDYFVDKRDIENVRMRLLNSGSFSEFNYSYESLRKYVERLALVFSV